MFDTWAGSLPPDQLERWVIAPTRRIVSTLRQRHPDVPVIGFPRGAGVNVRRYIEATKVDGIGCDTATPLAELKARIGGLGVVMQGNLDPLLLVAGGAAMERRVDEILAETAGAPFVFNLGHGIVPQTPPAHVARLVEIVRRQRPDGVVILWLKALHIVAVIAWMAGLLYLPRLFVYHAEAKAGSELSETLKVMERRLLRYIMNPAMIVVWITGPLLAWQLGVYHDRWFVAKLLLVAGLSHFHHLLGRWRTAFAADKNQREAKFYRIINEVPTVLMIGIVVLVVVKPF